MSHSTHYTVNSSGSLNATFNDVDCCPTQGDDLVVYCKLALAILFFLSMIFMSGLLSISLSIRALANSVRHARREVQLEDGETSSSSPQDFQVESPKQSSTKWTVWTRKLCQAIRQLSLCAMSMMAAIIALFAGAAPTYQINLPAPSTQSRSSD